MTLDGLIQTTQRDEFCYHEMLVHPALVSLEDVERVLIIGGGDGGTLRRVLEHGPSEVVMCEIDEACSRVCREHMPDIAAGAFDDPRVRLVIGDGAAFVAEQENAFDAIIVDGSDAGRPGCGAVLARRSTRPVVSALRPGGVFVTQSGSPMFQLDEFRMAYGNLQPVVRSRRGRTCRSSRLIPGVLWSYMTATDGETGLVHVAARRHVVGSEERKHHDALLHTRTSTPALFALPEFVREICASTVPTSVPRG